ncbi:MAG: hypothetical protein V4687_07085 [Bacteroidota bacterium]
MEKCANLLENKFVTMGLILLSVFSVYGFGKVIGQLAYYLAN